MIQLLLYITKICTQFTFLLNLYNLQCVNCKSYCWCVYTYLSCYLSIMTDYLPVNYDRLLPVYYDGLFTCQLWQTITCLLWRTIYLSIMTDYYLSTMSDYYLLYDGWHFHLPVHNCSDRKICCVTDVFARYGPDDQGGGEFLPNGRCWAGREGGSKSQFLLGRLWWMTPVTCQLWQTITCQLWRIIYLSIMTDYYLSQLWQTITCQLWRTIICHNYDWLLPIAILPVGNIASRIEENDRHLPVHCHVGELSPSWRSYAW